MAKSKTPKKVAKPAKPVALVGHVGSAVGASERRRGAAGGREWAPPTPPPIPKPKPPKKGELRFYKKVSSGGGRDKVVQVQGCRHRSWQPAKKADQAKKGIAHLEGGRSDWKTLQHCGSCEGGGMWRVQW